jgi:EAL domain-containing protein (putative c-di-GMP-specific phosphodiesterase class I)
MPSSTTTIATQRLSLRAPAEEARPRRYGRILGGRAREDTFSSPAGLHRRPWLARLRRALQEDLFVLHYQPIVSLRDGGVCHYEALLRLADRPDGALVLPGSFLPAAERYGMIRDIDQMVLGKVGHLLAGRAAAGARALTIAMNISAVSVTDASMLTVIDRELTHRGVDPGQLIVELTETAAISDMRRASEFCGGIQALGCAVALDDFGAGFGSFQYLKHLPFSYLKIDGDFIRGLPGSRTDQLVVKALVGVVTGMGRRTIAEFVGDAPTLEMLRSYGVDYAQGFQVGRPQPALPRDP